MALLSGPLPGLVVRVIAAPGLNVPGRPALAAGRSAMAAYSQTY